MSELSDIEDLELTHRVVLLGVADLASADETPVHAGEVRAAAADAVDELDADVVGTPTEAEVARALNELESETLLSGSREDTSPSGKGRPRFGLTAEPDAVLAELAADDRLADAVSRIETAK